MAILAAILPILKGVVDRVIPDKAAAQTAMLEMQSALLISQVEIDKIASETVRAEMQGDGWLQKNWRPITMLTFVALIVARWLGFSAPNLSQEEALALWDITKLGLGGYVIGRSAEKVLPQILNRK